jgi:hypothetical protein
MSLDGDDAFFGNIFDSVARTHRETGADVVQFGIKRSFNGGSLRALNYGRPSKDIFDNEELRKEVIAGHIMWSACLVSIERKLCMRAFDILWKRFNQSLCTSEDRLQMYVTFYFTRKLVILHQWGYLYFQMGKNWNRARWNKARKDRDDVESFLRPFYNQTYLRPPSI